jgi:hypothetical protein
MENRRNFLKKSALGTLGVSTVMSCSKSNKTSSEASFSKNYFNMESWVRC